MDQICVVFPLLPGKAEDARNIQRELDTERKPEYIRSEKAICIASASRVRTGTLPHSRRAITSSSFFMESEDFPKSLE